MLLSHFIQSFVFSQASQVLSALLLEINFQVIVADVVKTIHVIFVCVGVGGFRGVSALSAPAGSSCSTRNRFVSPGR